MATNIDTRAGAATGRTFAGPPRNRRRPGLLAAAAMLIALGGLLTAWLVASAGNRTEVLVVARDVPYGAVVTADDLAVTAVSADDLVSTVRAGDLDQIAGLVAVQPLTRGSLLARSQVADAAPPGAGEAMVPLPVPAERLPAGGLRAGDRLLVVDAPPQGADPPTTAPKTFSVTVVRAGEPDVNGISVVDVVIAASDGPALAERAASGRFALVVLPAQE